MMRPNIFLIVGDTLRKDYSIGLDKLTEFGFKKINNVYSAASWTLPSHASMFTGLYPSYHGIHEFYGQKYMVEDLAEISRKNLSKINNIISLLKSENYYTINISANAYISKHFGFEFDESYLINFPPIGIIKENESTIKKIDENIFTEKIPSKLKMLINSYGVRGSISKIYDYIIRNVYLATHKYYVDKGCMKILQILLSILKNNYLNPVFVFINLMESHEPYSRDRLLTKEITKKYDYNFLYSIFNGKIKDKHIIDHYKSLYPIHAHKSVQCILNIVSKLLKTYNTLGDNSVFIITADHGNLIGDKEKIFHGYYLYNELLEVPFYIRVPQDLVNYLIFDQNKFRSLTNIYDIIKGIIYNERINLNFDFVIAESFGPQYGSNIIKSYFNYDNETIKHAYMHRIKVISNGVNLIYNRDLASIEENNSISNIEKYIDIIRNYY